MVGYDVMIGNRVGLTVGYIVGCMVGIMVGIWVGISVGMSVDTLVFFCIYKTHKVKNIKQFSIKNQNAKYLPLGWFVGYVVGYMVGLNVGLIVGTLVGLVVGKSVGFKAIHCVRAKKKTIKKKQQNIQKQDSRTQTWIKSRNIGWLNRRHHRYFFFFFFFGLIQSFKCIIFLLKLILLLTGISSRNVGRMRGRYLWWFSTWIKSRYNAWFNAWKYRRIKCWNLSRNHGWNNCWIHCRFNGWK